MKKLTIERMLVQPNFKKEGTASALRRVFSWAGRNGVQLLMHAEHERKVDAAFRKGIVFYTERTEKGALADCDLILTIGGDGTLIRGAKVAAARGIPVCGVNTGTLGFLADIFPEETEVKLDRILKGKCVLDRRDCLSAAWGEQRIPIALNDIVLQKKTRGGICGVAVYFGRELVGNYRADGLIVSTPTGSTGYAYAAGGPIIHADADVISVIPLNPQYRMNIPLVCASDSVIRIVPTFGALDITADGDDAGSLKRGQELVVTRSKEHVDLIRFSSDWGVIDWMDRVGQLNL